MPLPEVIGSVAIGPLVAAIIEFLKYLGMPVAYARWANLVLSVAFWTIAQVYEAFPAYQNWIVAALQVIVIMLTAAGFYEEVVKRVVKKRFNR